MPPDMLGDREGKDILLGWPTRTKKLWAVPGGRGFWLQAQPKPQGDRARTPTISVPGAKLFKTQPDGMWAYLKHPEFADVVVVEISGSVQNLNDKRSRYAANVRSMILECPLSWLQETVALQRGGLAPRWEACRTISQAPIEEEEISPTN